jgi:hypothetical protein
MQSDSQISQFATVLIETVPAHWDEIQVDSGSTTPTWGESPHSLPVSAAMAEAGMPEEIADRSARAFRGSVRWIDLASIRDPETLPSTAATALRGG